MAKAADAEEVRGRLLVECPERETQGLLPEDLASIRD